MMVTLGKPLQFLTPDECETIHRNALRILSEIGMHIDHETALEYLESAGCKLDFDARRVKFPEDIVQGCVDKMKSNFAQRKEPDRMPVRYSHIRFRNEPYCIHEDFTVSAGGYNIFIFDTNGVRRAGTLEDTQAAFKLVDQLDQITHSGIPVAAQDVPLPIRPIGMVAELVKLLHEEAKAI